MGGEKVDHPSLARLDKLKRMPEGREVIRSMRNIGEGRERECLDHVLAQTDSTSSQQSTSVRQTDRGESTGPTEKMDDTPRGPVLPSRRTGTRKRAQPHRFIEQ